MWREGGVEPSGDGEARKLLRGYEGAYQTLMRVESEHGSDDRWNAANKRYQRARKEILARLERHGEVVAEGWNGKETDHIHRHAVWLTELCSDLVLGGEHGWTTLDREEFRRFRERVGKHLGDESRAVEAVLWDDDVGGDPRDLAREIVRLRKEIEHLRGRGANRNESG
ncbi:MAG: hypothetical protein GWN53_17135 [Gammaproteobacteria bacterium]|nr:hypothetical protein [Gammaproteobacteria bacterium]